MKAYFMARNTREKILVLVMLIVGVVIWGSFFAERAGVLMGERASLNRLNEELSIYIDNRELIRERAEMGIRNLDPGRTLTATRLSVDAGEMARGHGLNPSIDSPRTEPGDIFSYHTIIMTVNEADLEALINFTEELQSRAPYMSLEQVSINARSNPMLLDARYRISAVELNR